MEQQNEIKGVRIIKIISRTNKWKRGEGPRPGYKRVMAIVSIHGKMFTRHCDTKDDQFAMMKIYKKNISPKKVQDVEDLNYSFAR